ncbi:MAG: ABC transporter permease [Eubacteriales bacterium]|nr:ABC transporter permease [Eubacteriales bacterium]MDD4389574.1 ABC transporter permease [Eubacteriales bacterium]
MKTRVAATPYLLWSVLFIIVPLFLVGIFAFQDADGNFTFNNFISSVGYAPVIFNSIWLAMVATAICLVIAYPLAYIITRYGPRGQITMIMLILLPMWINFLLRTYAWMTLLENNGLINQFLGIFGIGPFQMINTQGAVVLGMVYNYLPFMILPIYAVMTKLDISLLEAARDLGASPLEVARRVTIPLALPGITTGITMVFVPSVSTFVISRMLGGGSFMLIGDIIEMEFLGNAYNPYLGSAISMVLMAIILICMALTDIFRDTEKKEGLLL